MNLISPKQLESSEFNSEHRIATPRATGPASFSYSFQARAGTHSQIHIIFTASNLTDETALVASIMLIKMPPISSTETYF